MPTTGELWLLLAWGYPLTVALETPVLLVGLAKPHPLRRRLLAGVWLTACSYPIVVLVLPLLLWGPYGRDTYIIVAETFAPASECLLFYLAFDRGQHRTRREVAISAVAIVTANLFSFVGGGWLVELWQSFAGA